MSRGDDVVRYLINKQVLTVLYIHHIMMMIGSVLSHLCGPSFGRRQVSRRKIQYANECFFLIPTMYTEKFMF